MHKETIKIAFAIELYVTMLAAVFFAAIYYLYRVFLPYYIIKWIILAAAVLIIAAAVYGVVFGKSVEHYMKEGYLYISYGVIFRYCVNIDFKKIIYITRVHGPFEKITGVTIFVFHLPGGRIYVPIGDKNKAEGYVKKWAKHIQ